MSLPQNSKSEGTRLYMTLTCDGQRLVLLQRQITWVESNEVSSSLAHTLLFLHS